MKSFKHHLQPEEVRSPMKTLVVIPTIEPDPRRLTAQIAIYDKCGFTSRIVANSANARVLCKALGLPFVDAKSNVGFGAAIKLATQDVEFDQLIIANDDLLLDSDSFILFWTQHHHEIPLCGISYLYTESPRSFPGRTAVFMNFSLLGRVVNCGRFGVGRREQRQTYQSFALVVIQKDVWRVLNGFCEDLPFTYEDADFARRAHLKGISSASFPNSAVHHDHSKSSRTNVSTVLPVSAWSALRYLDHWTPQHWISRWTNRIVLTTALATRILLIPFSSAHKLNHLKGIVAAQRAILFGIQPMLPKYEEV